MMKASLVCIVVTREKCICVTVGRCKLRFIHFLRAGMGGGPLLTVVGGVRNVDFQLSQPG